MSNAVVTVNGAPTIPTILGQATPKLRTAGKIRAGIKVLTQKAAGVPKAREIYEAGLAANRPFDAIEREIQRAVPEVKTPLVPKNVPYFTVRPADFPNPAIAGQILELFGEDRGDGVRRLYRFPVIFPADRWELVMPHELVAWGANERHYWSEYSPDGSLRRCMNYAPVPRDQTGTRAIRLFGGRKTEPRMDNGGVCDPERCPEYQNRQCNLSGRFIFFIPGIASIDAFEVPTNSFYAMNGAIQVFRNLAFVRGGRISGFLDGRQTPFYLTKKLAEVPRIDEQGKAVRVAQWIIELEAPVDVAALLQLADENEELVREAAASAGILEGSSRVMEGVLDSGEEGGDAPAGTAEPAEQDVRETVMPPEVLPAAEAAPVKPATSHPAGEPGINLEDVYALADQLGVAAERYTAYAAKRWGTGWKLNANGRRRAAEELRRYAGDPRAFDDKLTHELDVFS